MSYPVCIQGSFTSGGGVYDLQLPIGTDGSTNQLLSFRMYNYTKYGTNSSSLEFKWFKGMPNGSALILTRGTTTLSSTLETTNGFTVVNDTPLQGVELVSCTNANPGVFTFRGPGFDPGGGLPAFATGDKIRFVGVAGSASWLALNSDTEYTLTKVSATTFSFGVDTTSYGSYTASSGVAIRTQDSAGNALPQLNVANVGLRLGSAVVGADGDVFYYEALIGDGNEALGDIGA